MHPSHQQHAEQLEMASQLAGNVEEKYQPSAELVSPTDIRDSNVGPPDADTTKDPEHKSLAKEKVEKKATATSLFGRIIGHAYSWLTSNFADEENDNTKSPDDSDEATPNLFQAPPFLKLGRHERRPQNRFEDAEAASEYRLAFLGIFLDLATC
jgi:hypothetical protein